MLVSFTVENWMSFLAPAELSMIASRETHHAEHLSMAEKFKNLRLLPVAAIYGGNASGKSNLFLALNFARNLVVAANHFDTNIPVEPFRLDPAASKAPSRFSFTLLIDESMYHYGFTVSRQAVLEEWLTEIGKASEQKLFHRKDGELELHKSIRTDKELHDRLKIVFQGTQDNQLFMNNTVYQRINRFRPVFDWFKNSLQLVAPDTRFAYFDRFFDEADPLYALMNQKLAELDTGIAHLTGQEISLEQPAFQDDFWKKLLDSVLEGTTVRLQMGKDPLVLTRRDGHLFAKRLATTHPGTDGSEIPFEMQHESDGTRRAIDLLPMFLNLEVPSVRATFIVDELDRSLHTHLVRALLESFLDSRGPTARAQLLFTTHDVNLIDQELFRRDELWVTERDHNGASRLIAFSDYKDIRADKDIRKSYLQGRLGGIPRISLIPSTSRVREAGQDHYGHRRMIFRNSG